MENYNSLGYNNQLLKDSSDQQSLESIYNNETEELETISSINGAESTNDKTDDNQTTVPVDKLISGVFEAAEFIIGNSGRIRSGQTAWDVGDGWWIGDVNGIKKLSIGSSTGNKITWDGSVLNIVGSLTAGSISIGTSPNWFRVDTSGNTWWGGSNFATAPVSVTPAGAFQVTNGTITGGTIQTATTGQRIVIQNNKIDIYNSANTLVGTFQGLTGTYASSLQTNVAEINILAMTDAGLGYTVGTGKEALIGVDTGDVFLSTYTGAGTGGDIKFIADTGQSIIHFNDTIPNSDGTLNLGNGTHGWKYLYLGADGKYLENDSGTLKWNGSTIGNSGTVTSIATSGAITGGTITTSGTITHSTASGYKHIPDGGASSKFLKYSSDGTATWEYLSGSSCGSLIPSASTVTLGNSTYYWDSIYGDNIYVNHLRDRSNGYITVYDHLYSSSSGNDLGRTADRWGTFYGVSANILYNINMGGYINGATSIILKYAATNPASTGEIVNYASGGVDQFRGQPGDGTWRGSFDMTAY